MGEITRLLADPAAWVALATLIVLEVVLGIDNLVFISLLTNTLPDRDRGRIRTLGIALALVLRLALLSTIAFIVGLTRPVFTALGHAVSWRDMILMAGGLFLLWKATTEIAESVRPEAPGHAARTAEPKGRGARSLVGVVVQILLLDMVFSIDSILTAVGMTDHLPIMMAAVIVAVGLMMAASGPLAGFIRRNPSVVMLALGFLLMIGMTLIADGAGFHIPKGYIYAAMAFALLVEALNMLARRRKTLAAGSRAPDDAAGRGQSGASLDAAPPPMLTQSLAPSRPPGLNLGEPVSRQAAQESAVAASGITTSGNASKPGRANR